MRTVRNTWIFLPFLLGISSVLASPAAQITQADKNSESAFQLVQLLIGVLLTAALGYFQRRQNNNVKRLNTVEDIVNNTVPKEEHEELKAKIGQLESDSHLVFQKQIITIMQEMSTTHKGTQGILEKYGEKQDEVSSKLDDTLKIIQGQAAELTTIRSAVQSTQSVLTVGSKPLQELIVMVARVETLAEDINKSKGVHTKEINDIQTGLNELKGFFVQVVTNMQAQIDARKMGTYKTVTANGEQGE